MKARSTGQKVLVGLGNGEAPASNPVAMVPRHQNESDRDECKCSFILPFEASEAALEASISGEDFEENHISREKKGTQRVTRTVGPGYFYQET
jgi:hypothetical protein